MILKFTLRNLRKRPFLNLVKVIGLSLALSGLLIIGMFLKNELTYDKSHTKSGRIYRYSFTSENFFGGKHFARVYNVSYIPEMADYFPEIESFVRIAPIRGGYIKHNNKFIDINQAFECDSTFLNIFDCKLIVGNPENILDNPGSLIISESFAKKIFGDKNPIGEVLTLPMGQFYNEGKEFTVNGIMKDFPQNMHFHADFITTPVDKSIFGGWAWTYLLLKENADPRNIERKFKDFIASTSDTERSEIKMEAHLQNIADIHLHSNKLREIETNGNMMVVYTLSIAAFLLLFIALINYANLNIGMAVFSDKFIYINKISGASNRISLKYSLFEGFIIVSLTIITSIILTVFANNFIQKYYGINLLGGNNILLGIILLVFSLLSLIFGILPTLKNTINEFKSILRYDNSPRRKGTSKGLIILQYTVSIALIAAVMVIFLQTRYALNSSMGAGNEDIICFENVHTNVQRDFPVFKDELLKYSSINSVSAMFEPPGGEANDVFQFEMEGYENDTEDGSGNFIGVFPCDYSFADIFGLKFLSGKNFSEKYEDQEGSGEYIINEAAMKRLGYNDPDKIVGKTFNLIFNFGDIKIPKGKIIGVVEDFHFSTLKKEIEPYVFFKRKNLWISNFIISFNPGQRQQALNDLKTIWNKLFSDHPFRYNYVGSMYRNVYRTELLQVKLLTIFTLIALFICSMGLLGMSLLVAQRKTKEIGIRKVNGATVYQIVIMLNWDIIRWIIVSSVLSIPIAYYGLSKWLESFAYRTKLSWWIFGTSGLLALIISVLTVSLIAWNAARKNPVTALRYE